MSNPDPLSWTLLFKKHKTTVLLMLLPQESITNTKTALLNALKARGLTEINGDPLPEDASDIEFGVAVDKNDLEKGWTRLEVGGPDFAEEEESKKNAGKKASGSISLQGVDLRNGQSIAFRFKKLVDGEKAVKKDGEDIDIDLELEDPGWDVVVPKFDDEEEVEQ
ncbi:uncharacterized protein ACHE_20752S [Aspergillus chevalieri]|uniref:Uncharacterized protein n=1 Tax=Aspergillus chevalieri TaxID=182096 RepID=A0A7R7ZL70_ASPCH|nr:uncharacterized protein ACHE_20752S [Aspergillus chevalieri]BCR85294.1 hypothetical protein ACHE_20752S [Aspergillus chevalieri]